MVFGWFRGSKGVVDRDTADWHVENFAWLMRQFNQGSAFEEARLILPAPAFFRADGAKGHERACRLFEQVKSHCGMAEWPVALVADDNPAAHATQGLALTAAPPKHTLGMFMADEETVTISYAAGLIDQPEKLIATFAHELAHYLLATAAEPPLCPAEEMEFLTDLTAVYLGFGIFLANTHFGFEQFGDGIHQGWRMERSGYLPEADLVFALALFLTAKRLSADEACRYLKPHLGELLQRAMHQVATHDEAAALIQLAGQAASARQAEG